MVIGVALGILMGARRRADIILDGWHILFLNMPALVLIILCYVWFGLTEVAAIVAVALNKIPNVVVTVREGTRAVDRELLDVGAGVPGRPANHLPALLPAAALSLHHGRRARRHRPDLEDRAGGGACWAGATASASSSMNSSSCSTSLQFSPIRSRSSW